MAKTLAESPATVTDKYSSCFSSPDYSLHPTLTAFPIHPISLYLSILNQTTHPAFHSELCSNLQ
ncbi:MAG TPA: hypothetical protein PLT16_07725, partial [Daejeonella sp.]|nr:hypothetical protein [Daejeonella sp.]